MTLSWRQLPFSLTNGLLIWQLTGVSQLVWQVFWFRHDHSLHECLVFVVWMFFLFHMFDDAGTCLWCVKILNLINQRRPYYAENCCRNIAVMCMWASLEKVSLLVPSLQSVFGLPLVAFSWNVSRYLIPQLTWNSCKVHFKSDSELSMMKYID